MLIRIVKALASLTAMAAILAGTPLVLLTVGTNPWTAARWATAHLWDVDYSNVVLLGALTAIGWIAWLTMVQAFLAAVFDYLRPGSRPLPAITAQRAMFTVLLGAVLTTSTASWTTAAHTPLAGTAVVALHDAAPTAVTTGGPPVVHRGPNTDNALIHTVRRGEHLLDLAEHYYGNARAYPTIVAANSGITQPDGRALQPGETRIREGWQLRIPCPRTASADTTTTTTAAGPATTLPDPAGQHTTVHSETVQDEAVQDDTITLVANHRTYQVRVHRGDSLFTIAEQWLGDGDRWPEIYHLNKHRHFTDGRAFTSPRLIFAGWTLALPNDARPPADTPHPPAPGPVRPSNPGVPAAPPVQTTTPPPDDGVVPAPSTPPTSPSPTRASPSTAGPSVSPTAPTAPHSDASRRGTSPIGIDLPGGGWVDAGLAAALATAAAAVWAHRNRRYRRVQGIGRRRDADLPAVSALIRHVRARLAPTFGPRGRIVAASPSTTIVGDLATAPPTPQDPPQAHDPDTKRDAVQPAPIDIGPATTGEQGPGERGPAVEPAAVEPGDAVPVTPATSGAHADVWPTAGLGLVGPGALAAARGLLVSALASGTVTDPQSQTQVIIPATTLASLLGAAAVQVPNITERLYITDGLAAALEELDAQALYRARLCQEYDAVSIAEFRRQHPDRDFVPPLVLITDVGGEADQTRLEWALAAHYRLDVHGIVCGAWPRGDTVHVAVDGTTSPATGSRYAERHRHHHPADLGRLTVLDEAQTLEMLLTLIEADTGEPAPAPPADTVPHTADRDSDDEAITAAPNPHPHAGHVTTPATDDAAPIAVDDAGITSPLPPDPDPDDASTALPRVDLDTTAGNGADTRPVRVVVLGTPALPDYTGDRVFRGRSKELLTYLVANNGSAHEDAVLEDLLPDVTYTAARAQMNTICSTLRKILGEIAGVPAREFILRDPKTRTIRLGPTEVFDIDLWRMREGISHAKTATTSVARTRLLREAVNCYTAEFAARTRYPWADLYRERVRRDYIDAVLALTDEIADQPAAVLQIVKPAIGACPYSEALYQQAMKAHAALGDVEGIRRLRRTLTRSLEELGAEPEDDTRDLAGRLIAELSSRRRP